MSREELQPDIVDNRQINMAKVLNLNIPKVGDLDISTGYFDVSGYGMVRDSLESASKSDSFRLRLLLGKDAIAPSAFTFEQHRAAHESASLDEIKPMQYSLDLQDLTRKNLDDAASLVRLLRQSNIEVRHSANRFNHAKCYIMGDIGVLIGSSNLTYSGLQGNDELNAGLYSTGTWKASKEWFDRMWDKATDAKQDLIDVLEQSKFGVPPEPYDVYMKMLFEKYKPLLGQTGSDGETSTKLTQFQKDAVRTGMFIISEFGGTIIADSTGLGKTNMGIEIIKQKMLKEGKKVMIIAPAQVLNSMWTKKLQDEGLAVKYMLSMDKLGKDKILDDIIKYKNIDLILVDESQNFKSKDANRRKNLMKLMSVGKKKQAVLLSATPINNSLMDLYYQLSIITGGDDAHFYKKVGIPNLYSHMRDAANREGLSQGLEKIQQILDHVMVRRTRSYIKEVYKDDQINASEIKFPKHQYSPIKYSLSRLYGNIFKELLLDIKSLTMAPYGLEQYNQALTEEEKKKHRVLAHLQIILLLKRFESSIQAVRISIGNKINMYEYVQKILKGGKILRVRDFNKIMQKWNISEIKDHSDSLEEDDDAKDAFFLGEIQKIETEDAGKDYDMAKLKGDIDSDLKILKNLLGKIDEITVDTKLNAVIEKILEEKALKKESKKVLVFTEYTATAKYIKKAFQEKFKGFNVELLTGRTKPEVRQQYITRFAPDANLIDEELTQPEINILVSTEVLSEGQNLQDCNYVINYDLPWNPMRIVQRTGRIDRLTSKYDVVRSRACYPDQELDDLLQIMGKLIDKIVTVNEVIGLDAELLGETPTDKQFNGGTVKAIKALAGMGSSADGVIRGLEQGSDMMPSTSPINALGKHVKEIGMEAMKAVPMGRRSGKKGQGQHMVLGYLQEKPERQFYFVMYDYKKGEATVPDDEFEAIRNASCSAGEPRHLPMDGPSSQESFEELLKVDEKAREAIRRKSDAVYEYAKQLRQDKKKKFQKNIDQVRSIMKNEVMASRISADDATAVLETVKSEYIRPWEDDLNRLLSEHEQSKDTGVLIKGIQSLGKMIGLDAKKVEAEVPKRAGRPDLRLVGAMFITGAEFHADLDKKGLERY